MSTTIFEHVASALRSGDRVDRVPLAAITISTAEGNEESHLSNYLPILAISELSHQNRQQVDSALDGTVHVLSAAGGLATCQMTFMDRLSSCGQNTDSSSTSALATYRAARENLGGSSVRVSILGEDGKSSLATFTGVIKACTVTAQNKNGMDTLLVTYTMQGVME